MIWQRFVLMMRLVLAGMAAGVFCAAAASQVMLAGGPRVGLTWGRSGPWLLACCSGPGAGDPRGDGQDRAGVLAGEAVQGAPVPGAELEAGQGAGQDLGVRGGGQVASGGGLDGPARYGGRLGRGGYGWLLHAGQAGERGDGFEQQRVDAGLLVGGAAGAELGDRVTLPGPAARRPGAAGGSGRRAAPAGMASPG